MESVYRWRRLTQQSADRLPIGRTVGVKTLAALGCGPGPLLHTRSARDEPAEAPTDQGAFRLALRRGLGSACGGSGTPAMAAIHSAAELEALKALLAAGLSRSEIGARLGLRRSVLCWLVHRLQAQGRRAAAFKARAKAEDHHAAEAVADHRIRTAHCHRRTIARTGRQCLPMAGRRRRSRHAVLRRRSRRQLARVVLSASCGAQRCGRGAGSVRQGAVDGAGHRV